MERDDIYRKKCIKIKEERKEYFEKVANLLVVNSVKDEEIERLKKRNKHLYSLQETNTFRMLTESPSIEYIKAYQEGGDRVVEVYFKDGKIKKVKGFYMVDVFTGLKKITNKLTDVVQ